MAARFKGHAPRVEEQSGELGWRRERLGGAKNGAREPLRRRARRSRIQFHGPSTGPLCLCVALRPNPALAYRNGRPGPRRK